jgi:two-component system, chemotaxis family, protein-glutamate methylesterase/glutaminase
MSSAVAAALHASNAHKPIRVMVVDDAVVVRGLLARWVDAEPDMEITAVLRTGREAVDQVERANPDVVLLDVDMPELDGISALPLLLQKKRDLVVIMASTLTRRNAEISLRALALGAADYIPKPETTREVTNSASFRRELVEKIRHLGRRHRTLAPERRPVIAPAESKLRPPSSPSPAPSHVLPAVGLHLRPFAATAPRVLLIGSSTGGPQALSKLVGHLDRVIDRVPVLITQHMPRTFTTVFAEQLARASGRNAQEAEHGEAVVAGKLYLAPGGRHMRVVRRNLVPTIELDDGPLVNFCKPAVDPLFSAAAAMWGDAALALILTGMGADGTRGAADIVAAGGSVIAQDEETSVVWGMPGSAARAGVCAAVLPLGAIAEKLGRLFAGDGS